MRDLCRAAVEPRSARAPRTPTPARSSSARQTRLDEERPGRDGQRRRDARASASACCWTAPGGSPATAASTPRARATRRCARRGFARAARRPRSPRRSRRCLRRAGRIGRPSSRTRSRSRSSDKVALCLRAEAALRHDDVKVTEAFVRAQREHKFLFTSRRRGRSSRSSSRPAAGSTRSRSPTAASRSAQLSRARTAAQRGRPAGSTSTGSGSSARRRGSARRRPRSSRADAVRPGARRSSSTPSRWRCRCTSRSATRSSSTASTAPRRPTPARASSRRTTSGSLRYGSALMNVTADPTTPGGLGTFGFDDEGVPAAARADRRRGRAARIPHLARDRRAARRGRAAARCAPTAGAGCRSSA